MIDTLITALSKELELSAEEIADTIWLALQIQESQSESTATQNSKNDLSQPSLKSKELEGETLPETKTKTSDSGESASKQSPDEQKAGIYPRNQQKTPELSFKVPDAPSLREPLTLARALKPLMRRIPSGTTLVLDEAATTQQIANEGLWLPVLRPTLEPWLDLELVVDEGISMQIWRHTIRELERLLKNYGIFRDVRVWGLIADNLEQVQIRRGIGATAKNQSPRSPAELIDPSGRRLVLVVSDCVSSLWRDGKVTTTLEIWAKQGSMAIVQMLPKWLWKRTALGRASEVRLQGLNPGDFNQKLIAKEVSLWDELEEMRGVKVPVFTLEPDKVATWAQMLSGKGSIWTSGYVFKLEPIPVNKGRDLFNLNYGQQNAEQRVQAFRVTASPMARKLAGLLAAAPAISLPIVRLIQRTLLKESQQVHVAEVFLGGLLKPLSEINAETNPDYVRYEFMDGVRELLVDSVPSGYVLNVVDEVSKDVAKNLGLSLEDFAAVLRNPQQVRDSDIAGDVGYFATVTAQVLRRLGGEYVKVAEELELNDSVKAKKISTNISTSETFQHGYALLIGVGECQYKALSLPITVKDTQAIYTTLVDQDLCAYPDDPDHIRVLNNEQATRFDILEGLQWLKQKAEEDSEATVFVYYSGHGWVDKTDNHYYLLPHDTKASTLVASALSSDEFMEGIRQSALSADGFMEGIRQIESERLLVMIDAVNSGKMTTLRHSEEVGEEFLNYPGNSHNISPFKTFVSSLKQGKGRIIFTSSQGDQKSWFKDNSISLYTFHFLEALKGVANQPGDTTIKISNLVSYLSETVPQTAKKLHNANQTPCFDVDGSDFVIAKLRGGNGLPNIPLLSEKQIDYTKLRKLLITQNWKEADEETTRLMLQASGQEQRGWLDEEDMKAFPSIDLQTIDQLWSKYSNGRFGFSVQKRIWENIGGTEDYDNEIIGQFSDLVGWRKKEVWLTYSEINFDLNAPEGHLPVIGENGWWERPWEISSLAQKMTNVDVPGNQTSKKGKKQLEISSITVSPIKVNPKVLDEEVINQINTLALKVKEYPSPSLERRRALNKLIKAVNFSGKVYRLYDLDYGVYEEILQETWIEILNKIDEYNPEKVNFLSWFNHILYSRCRFVIKKQSNEIMKVRSLDVSLSSFDELESINLLDAIPAHSQARSTIEELREFIEKDPQGIFASSYIKNHPEANFRAILLRRFEEKRWTTISVELGIPVQILVVFYQRCIKKFTPIFKEYLQE